ncbi:hypothetical protein [Rhodopirellula europaea]|uniref:hypothetical protein n=1 Tax=Rhodopirellula europaea TaxID=1263866 RepID=UPI003D27212D|tara:strand:- start:1733 stop:2203 length:471 start_codon:yes stop_codon:yes gene_type:complete
MSANPYQTPSTPPPESEPTAPPAIARNECPLCRTTNEIGSVLFSLQYECKGCGARMFVEMPKGHEWIRSLIVATLSFSLLAPALFGRFEIGYFFPIVFIGMLSAGTIARYKFGVLSVYRGGWYQRPVKRKSLPIPTEKERRTEESFETELKGSEER